ncbi:hypothetical protein [Fervidibacillus halotolerans]|uniref:Uncharacterized protein n=1 Tax=Fervidibacillus halotolerans TaxID=2980027 RepID=A0A9E8M0T2_9BACI|nr:hypothetical protein [Fervidibacillus halotolerans]WAA13388.1 hypothetical protein OE105_04550 [Fervidibacillus halotolerans]
MLIDRLHAEQWKPRLSVVLTALTPINVYLIPKTYIGRKALLTALTVIRTDFQQIAKTCV